MVTAQAAPPGVSQRNWQAMGPAQRSAIQSGRTQALSESKRVTRLFKEGKISEDVFKDRMNELAMQAPSQKLVEQLQKAPDPARVAEAARRVKEAALRKEAKQVIVSRKQEIEQAIRAGKVVLERPTGEIIIRDVEREGVSEITRRAIEAERMAKEVKREVTPFDWTGPDTSGLISIKPPSEMPFVHITKTEFAPDFTGLIEKRYVPGPVITRAAVPSPVSLGIALGEIIPAAKIKEPETFEDVTKVGTVIPGFREEAAKVAREVAAKEEARRIPTFSEFIETILVKPFEFLKPGREFIGGEEVFPTTLERAIPSFIFGAATFPAAVARLPQTIFEIVTQPGEVFKSTVERFTKDPTTAIAELAGSAAAGFGISKVIGKGVELIKARQITTAIEVGKYQIFLDKPFGEVVAKVTVLKKFKPIEAATVQIGFKVPKIIFQPSPFLAKVVAEKAGRFFVLGKAVDISRVTAPSGLAVSISKAAGIAFKFPGFKRISAIGAIAKTTALPKGTLQSVGFTVTKAGLVLRKQRFFTLLFRHEPPVKITRIIPSGPAVTAEVLPSTVTAQLKTVSKLITKETVKRIAGKPAVRVGVISGAISQIIGRGDVSAATQFMPREEEELIVSPKARAVVGVPALDTRVRTLTLQRLGISTKQTTQTLQRFGIGQQQVTQSLSKLGIGRPVPSVLISAIVPVERVAKRVKPLVTTRLREPPRLDLRRAVGLPSLPAFVPAIPLPGFPIPVPITRRKPPARPAIPPVLKPGFDVFVKRRRKKVAPGKFRSMGFRKANVAPLPRKAALGLGAGIVDKFVNRSFTIKKSAAPVRATPGRIAGLQSMWRAKGRKFRKSKSGRVLVERSRFAIDSPQEKRGIPYKAQRLRLAGLLPRKKRKARRRKR